MKHIIISYAPGTDNGLTVSTIGPFDSFDAAREYGQTNLADSRWVVANLDAPTITAKNENQGSVHA